MKIAVHNQNSCFIFVVIGNGDQLIFFHTDIIGIILEMHIFTNENRVRV